VKGIISDAGKAAAALAKENDWFDVSTLKEPYRLEGKKTMGLELAEGFDWELPDVILYPTGGGTGLVGMWKAFEELGAMGWLGEKRPKMVAVQTTGCAPIVRAFEAGAEEAEFWQGASTVAAGLRVPHAFGHRLILDILYKSGGYAVAVSDQALLEAQSLMARTEGLFAAPEGAATLAGAIKLLEAGWLDPSARIVLYNTGTGLKYVS
jgi:threonine synthase